MTDQLNQALEQLRTALGQTESLDAKAKESLEALADDIERILNLDATSPQNAETGSLGIPERIQGWIEQQESLHPEWTRILSMIAERLADMGI